MSGTSIGRPTRGARGRLLIVGDETIGAALGPRLRQPAIEIGNLFEAIGEINASRAGRPIVAALIDEDLLTRGGRRAPEAIRRLDPSVRLVRIVRADAGEPGAIEGCDLLSAPVDPDALARLLGDDCILPAVDTPPPPPAQTVPAAPGEAAAVALVDPPPPPPAPPPPPPVEPPPGTPAAAAIPTADETTSSPRPATPRSDLGDTDLVHAVMNDPEGVTATALHLVREHTGWTDVELRPPDAASAAEIGRTIVATRCGRRTYGTLATRQAAPEELGPWADWLGQWLALDGMFREYRRMAFQDDLTGTWNRRYFHHFLQRTIDRARDCRRPVTVMVFDIDDFKRYNDEFSHEAGDVILRETVALLHSVIRSCDRVCRIGGDEFAVIFADLDQPRETGSRHLDSVETIARRFQAQICAMRFPKLGLEAPGSLSISAGLATFPWDGSDPTSLLRLADERALESKRRGKNHITFGPDAAHPGDEECSDA